MLYCTELVANVTSYPSCDVYHLAPIANARHTPMSNSQQKRALTTSAPRQLMFRCYKSSLLFNNNSKENKKKKKNKEKKEKNTIKKKKTKKKGENENKR
ncbi:hypothetical protein EVAR_49306_1 [Eumeta japonica]|uniref:Uncharacterized protein n=1 Tax=Eumeta variegata TaxID=151549 RepID=A0A4C1XQI8_EUMVA|nr:hypothetical protein EVAR_49306_1 [Eumeta japonica]